jgi:hypothetical protein
MKEEMKLTDKDKAILGKALKETNNLPPSQGKVTLNISPEGKVVTVEINVIRR